MLLYPEFPFIVFTMALFILTSQRPAYPIRGSEYTVHFEIPGTDSLSDNRGRGSGLLWKADVSGDTGRTLGSEGDYTDNLFRKTAKDMSPRKEG